MSRFGGVDLCKFPAGIPPHGIQSNFKDPPTYAPAVIAVTAVVLFVATLFTGCRLCANWKTLRWSDHFNTMALILSIGQSGIMLAQLKFVRHQWDIPACWFFENYAKLIFSQQMMLTPGIIFSKVSLLLLILQIFDVRGGMKLAIRIGLVATVLFYIPSVPVEAIFQAPAAGESWADVMISGRPQRAIYWGIVQSLLGIILDLYIFVLPLPAVSQLHMSRTKRIQLGLVFSTAFMGVVANILSLVYRVIEFMNISDGTWHLYALLLCTVVELNIAIIVCSVPGLAKFCRTYAASWSPIRSLLRSSKFANRGSSANASGSSPQEKQSWSVARRPAPSLRPDVEAGTNHSILASSNGGEVDVDKTHDYVELEDRWQVGATITDPSLDTAGPDYSWMHATESRENIITDRRSAHDTMSGF